MSIRKSFYTLSQDYFFPADPHFAEQGFVEFAGYDVQATAGRGEIGQGALRLQEAEQAVGGRCFLLHGRLRFVSAKMKQRCEKSNRHRGVRRGLEAKKIQILIICSVFLNMVAEFRHRNATHNEYL